MGPCAGAQDLAKAIPQWRGARGGQATRDPFLGAEDVRRPHPLRPAPPGLPVPGDPRPLRRYCRAPVPAVRLPPHPWGRFRVGACGGDRGFGACQDQLGDKPLACYLLPLLACVSLVSALGGGGVWFGFLRGRVVCVGLGPGLHVPGGVASRPPESVVARFVPVYCRSAPGALPGSSVPAPSEFWFRHSIQSPALFPLPGRRGPLSAPPLAGMAIWPPVRVSSMDSAG